MEPDENAFPVETRGGLRRRRGPDGASGSGRRSGGRQHRLFHAPCLVVGITSPLSPINKKVGVNAKELADLEQHFDGGFSSALLPFAVPLGLDAEHFRKVLGVFIVQ